MQKLYGRNQIPDLRKKSGIMEYLDVHYLDPKSMHVYTIYCHDFHYQYNMCGSLSEL